MTNLGLEHWVRIKKGKIILDGEVLLSSEADITSFLKSAYKFLNSKYSKFHKMDRLSKLGFIAAEFIFSKATFSENTALIFSNSNSSLESDVNYQASITDFPSPALFVYTLPNIVLGEISIRFGLKSENVFFIEESLNTDLLLTYANQLLTAGKADAVVCGWLNLHNAEYDVFLWTVSETKCLPDTKTELHEIYNANYD